MLIDGVAYEPGTGEYAGLYTRPTGGWFRIEQGKAVRWSEPRKGSGITGRMVGGVIALLVAAVVAFIGLGWIQGFADLDAQGNPFAGILALFGIGAWVVAAGFGVWGIVLMSRK